MKIEKCAYNHCDNDADFYDAMGDAVCEECMERQVQHCGDSYDDFESIGDL
jgi:hypothetical protein